MLGYNNHDDLMIASFFLECDEVIVSWMISLGYMLSKRPSLA